MAMNMYRPSSSQRSGSGSQKSFVSCLEITTWDTLIIQIMCLDLRQGKRHFHSPCQTKKKHQKGHLKVSTSLVVLFGLYLSGCLLAYTLNKTYTADSPGQVFLTCQVERRTCIPKKHLHGSQLPPQTNIGTPLHNHEIHMC